MNWRTTSLGLCLALCGISWAQSTENERQISQEMTSKLEVQADHWFKEGDFPRAIQALRMRYAMMPGDMEAMTDLGWLLESTDRPGEALALYGEFRRNHPDHPDACLPEAEYFMRKRVWAKIPPLLEGQLKPKTHPNGYRMLANAYERLGRLQDCVRTWEAYLKLHPNDEQAKVNLARVSEKLRKKS